MYPLTLWLAVAKQQTISDETPEESDENQKGKRKTKVVFEIDFLNSEDIDEDVLFANDKKGSITMPIKRDVKNVRHLLPDDMHFSSKQLLHYFLKPEHSVSGPSWRSDTLPRENWRYAHTYAHTYTYALVPQTKEARQRHQRYW